jgi:hypothetical protein
MERLVCELIGITLVGGFKIAEESTGSKTFKDF